jgi:hypothetical protein
MISRLAHPGRSPAIAAAAIVIAAGAWFGQSAAKAAPAGTCPGGDTGITLSPGFCATVFADNLGHVRHLALRPTGPSTPTPAAGATITTTRTMPTRSWPARRSRAFEPRRCRYTTEGCL